MFVGAAVSVGDSSVADYQALAEIRYQIRRFLRCSEEAARAVELEPQQHQLLLTLIGLPEGKPATVSALAERLQIRHHSAVGLIDRLEERGLVARSRAETDRRQVFVRLTPQGEAVLRDCLERHREALHSASAELIRSLNALTESRTDLLPPRSLARNGAIDQGLN